jgi:predicted SAM-dependent methyltransferase
MGMDAKPVKVEIGSGDYPRDGYTHVDVREGLPHQDHQASVFDLPFEDGSVDEILGVAVIEHIPQSEVSAAMRELHRVLRIGGMLKLYTFNLLQVCQRILDEAAPLGELVSNLYGGHDYPENIHHWAYTPETFRQLFESHGFEIIHAQKENGLYMEGKKK